MKRSGRTLKQRLYGLKHLTSRVRRARHFRGHGVHSPYVYSIVRQVFMRRNLLNEDNALYDALHKCGIAARRCVQLDNLLHHCGYSSWSINSLDRVDMLVATLDVDVRGLAQYVAYAREHGATLCIMDPYHNAERWQACKALIEAHPSTTVDNRAYVLFFNNHLPLQRFVL